MNDNSGLTSAMGLEQRVEDALEADTSVARYPIGVAVQGTSVSLTGEVGSQAAKETAERVARGVSGVIDVTNELVVVERDDASWGLFGRRRRDTAGAGGNESGVDGTVGVAALGAASGGLGGAAGSAGLGASGAGAGAIGLGAGAALATEGAARDVANDEGYNRSEDTEEARG